MMQTEDGLTDRTETSDEDDPVVDTNGESADKDAAGAQAEPEPEPASQQHVCPVAFCPIGMALSTMERSGPDALEHLLAAGREVLLAAKAMVDARASDVAASPGLEKIEVH